MYNNFPLTNDRLSTEYQRPSFLLSFDYTPLLSHSRKTTDSSNLNPPPSFNKTFPPHITPPSYIIQHLRIATSPGSSLLSLLSIQNLKLVSRIVTINDTEREITWQYEMEKKDEEKNTYLEQKQREKLKKKALRWD